MKFKPWKEYKKPLILGETRKVKKFAYFPIRVWLEDISDYVYVWLEWYDELQERVKGDRTTWGVSGKACLPLSYGLKDVWEWVKV